MDRRQLLRTTGVGASITLFAGCLGGLEQSGSGHPCDDPRNIDYPAVDTYRDYGVYLENDADAVHTACVTVTKEPGDAESSSDSPPLEQMGYRIHPEMAVEVFNVTESGRYMIEVSIQQATKELSLQVTAADLADETSNVTRFEITAPTQIRVSSGGDS